LQGIQPDRRPARRINREEPEVLGTARLGELAVRTACPRRRDATARHRRRREDAEHERAAAPQGERGRRDDRWPASRLSARREAPRLTGSSMARRKYKRAGTPASDHEPEVTVAVATPATQGAEVGPVPAPESALVQQLRATEQAPAAQLEAYI